MTWQTFLPELEERFLRYVQIDTQSDEASQSVPTTLKQLDLLRLLADELRQMGAGNVVLTDYACVLATLPGNQPDAPTVAFVAHVDTTADYSGANVRPIVHRNYDGAPIPLPDDPKRWSSCPGRPWSWARWPPRLPARGSVSSPARWGCLAGIGYRR